MAEIIRMPRMSDTMEEGIIVEWHKKVGESVEPGDILAEVETDKATMDLESYHEGVLLHIGIEKGPVPVNGILAVIGEKGEDFAELLTAAESEENATAAEETTAVPEAVEEKVSEALGEQTSDALTSESQIKASPLARKMATENNIPLSSLSGSGEHGRIIKRDIEAALNAAPVAVSSSAEPPASLSNNYSAKLETKDIPLSSMRKVIAKRLAESKFQAPHFYVTSEIDMQYLIEARKRINADAPPKISFNDLIVKAAAMALRKHPFINASWLGDKIRLNGDINIGVAVAVEEGLLVPVVRHADQKGLAEINEEVKFLAGKARERRLTPEQMSGNTFTISNLGMFDVDEFTAIINPPDSCILAVGSIIQKPVVENGQIVVGNRMKVTLSCDHRVVDGALGAQFLLTLKSYLENPVKMML